MRATEGHAGKTGSGAMMAHSKPRLAHKCDTTRPATTPCAQANLQSAGAMAFPSAAITEVLATAASGAFNGADAPQIREWVEFVIGVDPNPAAKHDVFYYVAVARLLAESVGSVSPSDFEDPHMREMIKAAITVNALPYAGETDEKWKNWKVVPAQVAFALRVQAKCAQAAAPGPSVGVQPSQVPTEFAGMAEAVKQFAELQSQALQKGKPKGLTFKLQERKIELGMGHFSKDALPSEEILAKFEASAKVAHDKGRPWIGSAEGEDLRDHHRPSWSRTPEVDALIGEGSYEDRVKQSAAAKKSGGWVEKIDYVSFATFMGHLYEWGFKVILTKACTMSDFMAYAHNIIRIAEEHGGVRTAFQYDVLQRKAMAKALERDETNLTSLFTTIDRDVLKDAKDKVDKRFAELAAAKGQAKGSSKGFAEPAAAAAAGSKGGKGGKSGKDGKGSKDKPVADRRHVRSPQRRPKDDASNDHQTRSRSPRASEWHQSGSWEKRSWR